MLTTKPRQLLLLAFTEGAAVMAAELFAGMIVAPFFGNTIISWAIVLAVTLGGLACGYYLGGRLSVKFPVSPLLKLAMITGGFFLLILPFWAPLIMETLIKASIQTGLTLSLLAFLFPPLVAFGSVSPLLIHKITDSTKITGSVAGTVYGISTVGGIFYTLLLGLWIIPQYGIRMPAIISGGIVLMVAVLVLFSKQGLVYGATICALVFFIWHKNEKALEFSAPPSVNLQVHHHSEGLLGQVKVMDFGWKGANGKPLMARALLVDNTWQTAVNRQNGISLLNYVYYILPIVKAYPEESDMLVVGLGGGGLIAEMQNSGYDPEVVELDARLAELSKRYFGVANMDKVVVDDGRHFLNTSNKKYDVIILDVFQGEVPPWQLFTFECFRKIKSMLNPNGCLIVEFFGDLEAKEASALNAVYKTLSVAGFKVQVIDIEEREKLLIASEESISLQGVGLTKRNYIDKDISDLSVLMVPASEFDTTNVPVLTDNLPRLEKMVLKSSLDWRKYQNDMFRDNLAKLRYPVFH